ncbi:3-hydroxyacyl-CoA dehydrogenase [Novosphingobium sp. Leaf2]|uniref:3-hydroxyacyl-CoA dehydrogenase n=1 Tax=Novosphingobium sp. Leaf2 TaxID=1735670 RepID=UPI000B0363D7|nr:3-hydroxyacyl-CoA dehydrogenase [Novosphingobium sp. Leaf2]
MRNIVIAGSGVLGTQIAFQAALHGYDVTVYDIDNDVLERGRATLIGLGEYYAKDMAATPGQIDATLERLTMTGNLGAALANADLLIESVPEILATKIAFYEKAAKVAPAKTIFATNSSTLLPSQMADATGRADKFLALHFANEIWKRNIAEVMGHAGTAQATFDAVTAFAGSIGMVTVPVHKERPGYIINSLMLPWVMAGLKLWADDVAGFKSIDKSWMVATGSNFAPFMLVDIGGMNTAYNMFSSLAEAYNDPLVAKAAQRIKTEFIDNGLLGAATGEGFYKYPNPEYLSPAFLS